MYKKKSNQNQPWCIRCLGPLHWLAIWYVEEHSSSDGLVVEEYNLKQFNQNLNDDNPINDYDNILDVTDVDIGIDDHTISSLDIYDLRNLDIFDAKTWDILIKNGLLRNWISHFL